MRVEVNKAVAKPSRGFRDGGHQYIKCSNCEKILLDIWITMPDLDADMDVEANCPFCGDKSFRTTIHGGFAPAGYFVQKPDSEDVINYTNIRDTVIDSNANITRFVMEDAKCQG
jgi:hypothetical protein